MALGGVFSPGFLLCPTASYHHSLPPAIHLPHYTVLLQIIQMDEYKLLSITPEASHQLVTACLSSFNLRHTVALQNYFCSQKVIVLPTLSPLQVWHSSLKAGVGGWGLLSFPPSSHLQDQAQMSLCLRNLAQHP